MKDLYVPRDEIPMKKIEKDVQLPRRRNKGGAKKPVGDRCKEVPEREKVRIITK
jgi:hypothetical protein